MSCTQVPCANEFSSSLVDGLLRSMDQRAKAMVNYGAEDDDPKLNAYLQTSCLAPKSFCDSDCPPDAPHDPAFSFLVSTFFVETDYPSEIGRSLLNFLSTQVDSTVNKV